MPTATTAAPAADASRLVMLLLLRCCCCSRRCCCPASCCCCVVCCSCWAAARTHTDCLLALDEHDVVRNALRCRSIVCCIVLAMCMQPMRQTTDLTVHAAQTMSWVHNRLYRPTQCKTPGSAAYLATQHSDGREAAAGPHLRAMSWLSAARHAQQHAAHCGVPLQRSFRDGPYARHGQLTQTR